MTVHAVEASPALDSRNSIEDSWLAAVGPARPFFGFYGGKWRDAVKNYPKPAYTTIVEPFAGSAGYSLRYCHVKVVLCEIDPIVASVWQFLVLGGGGRGWNEEDLTPLRYDSLDHAVPRSSLS